MRGPGRPGKAQPPPGEMTDVVPESVPGGALLFLVAGDVEDLRAGADREIAEGAEIAVLIAHDLAVSAHQLQIDEDHPQRGNDFLPPDEQIEILSHLHVMAAIDIRQPLFHAVQTLPGVKIVVEIDVLIALGRAVGVLIAHANERIGKARQRPRLGIQAGEDETGLNRGQRQPLFYPAEGVQPRGGFVR